MNQGMNNGGNNGLPRNGKPMGTGPGTPSTMTAITPTTPPKVDESKLELSEVTPSEQFMKYLAFEAVSSSQDWRKRWYAPDFGAVSIFTVPGETLDLPHGVILPWRRDTQGSPEVVLHASIRLPSLKRLSPLAMHTPVGTVTVDIRQYLSFYYRDFAPGMSYATGSAAQASYQSGRTPFPYYSGVIMKRDGWAVPASTSYTAAPYTTEPYAKGGTDPEKDAASSFLATRAEGETGWMASASPYYITRTDEMGTVTVLDVREGRGAWNARVGSGGLMVKNFVEGGLAAARTELIRTFRDEEIQWFLKGNSDVLFYLRPQ